MKIAIHANKGSFSDPWITYCKEHKVNHVIVNCYDSDILSYIKDCDILMWHHNHANPKDVLFAKQLLFSFENAGKVVFPDFYTGWHFDDKLGQMYLFEAQNIPMVKSHAFYSKKEALKWASNTIFPKVFKLRTGAGSRNVKLIRTKEKAIAVINKAFGKGFRQYDAVDGIKEAVRRYKLGNNKPIDILKAIAHLVYPIQLEKSLGRERGYVYFQDFIPNNEFDIRVIVIGDKAFAIKRNIRKNDFRASGSGFIEYEKEHFDDAIIALSFENAMKTKNTCAAFDYVFLDNEPLIVEVSFGFNMKGYYDCPGYWSKDLQWHEGDFNPYGWMIENSISKLKSKIQ